MPLPSKCVLPFLGQGRSFQLHDTGLYQPCFLQQLEMVRHCGFICLIVREVTRFYLVRTFRLGREEGPSNKVHVPVHCCALNSTHRPLRGIWMP
jgi:hypothetical protein